MTVTHKGLNRLSSSGGSGAVHSSGAELSLGRELFMDFPAGHERNCATSVGFCAIKFKSVVVVAKTWLICCILKLCLYIATG